MISPHTMTAAVGGTAMDTSERLAIFKRVTSDYVTYGPMRLALYQLAPSLIVSSSTTLAGTRMGVYDSRLETITIRRALGLDVKRCVLVHELAHWVYDDDSRPPYGAKREQCVRRITADVLIDENKYMQAEQMYEGDIWQIADDLSVYPGVVDDYRKLVIPSKCGWHHAHGVER